MTHGLSRALLARGFNASWDTGVHPGATHSRVPRTHPLPASLSRRILVLLFPHSPCLVFPIPSRDTIGCFSAFTVLVGFRARARSRCPTRGWHLSPGLTPSPLDQCAQHDALPWACRGEQGGRVLPLWGLQWGSRQADVSRLITETARRGERLPGCEQA